jgi:hypothetical protein
MRRITAVTEIAAPVEAVWAQLTDTASFPEWNPFIASLEGTLREGERLTVRITPPGGKAMTFRPTVTAYEEGRRLEWLGRLLIPGLVDGRHSFTLEPTETGTRLTQEETFTGVLVPLAGGTLAKAEEGFRAMNEALQSRVTA